MSYLVFCTFDLQNATSQNYKDAYSDLKKIGLEKVQKSDQGNVVVIPTTSVMGGYDGDSAPGIRDEVRDRVKRAFNARGFRSEIFVVVGGNWAWGAAST